MKLTAENVIKVAGDCMFKDGEDTSNMVTSEGIVAAFGFHPERLKEQKQNIIDLLDQLPDTFRIGEGGGWSFLNACMDKEGNQWGEHKHIELLVCLGQAVRYARYMMKDIAFILPGGMPYVQIGQQLEPTIVDDNAPPATEG
jgi:hypothetical protein